MFVVRSAFFAVLFLSSLSYQAVASAASPRTPEQRISFTVTDVRQNAAAQQNVIALRERIRRHGETLVLLELRSVENNRYLDGIVPSPSQVAGEIAAFRQYLQSAARDQFRIKREMPYLPLVSLYMREQALDATLASGLVHRLHTVEPVDPALSETTRKIGSRDASYAGYGGTGTSIAILDTGVARDHPFLTGKVVHELCFGTNGTIDGLRYTSSCPGGGETGAGPGSAAPCRLPGCEHGTHVAGIAAGGVSGSSFFGVAPGANIIALQVFSVIEGTAVGGLADDIIAALQQVWSLRNIYTIAAVNMSFGGSSHTSSCDARSPFTSTIDLLRGAGILSVASSGNGSSAIALRDPACVSSVIAVGSVNDNDVVSAFSNSESALDLLAPGEMVYSSALANDLTTPTYENFDGTSMAAAHVSGAIAVLLAQVPSRDPDTIENLLEATGPWVTDARNGLMKRRLDVQQAVGLAERPILQAAFSRCEGANSVYSVTWREGDPVAATSWDVDISNGTPLWSNWYQGSGEAQALAFDGGTRYLRARGYNNVGWGQFTTISVSDLCNPPPAPVVQKAFVECNADYSIYEISWRESNNVPVASWDVDISTNGSTWADWYGGTDRFKQISFDGGTRYFRVRGSNASGWSPYSSISAVDGCTGSGTGPLPDSRSRR